MWNSDQMSVKEAANQNSIGNRCDKVYMAKYHRYRQGRTGHSSNATLVARAFKISHTKYQKRGLLEEFWRPFEWMPYPLKNLARLIHIKCRSRNASDHIECASVPYDFNKRFRKFDGIH
jgi:hypothetical protein